MRSQLLRLSIILALALLAAPASVSAEVAKWNQERVAKLAAQFADQADQVQKAFRALRGPEPGGPRESFFRMRENIRVVRTSARHLSNQLANGASQEETLPTYRRLMTIVNDVQEESRRVGIIPATVMDAITTAGATLNLIRPYYDPDWKTGESIE